MKRLWMGLAMALLLGGALRATPTRILTIDNGNLIVPDDWDATYYYSLAPNFKDHLYFDQYADGHGFGWAFLDLKLATLVLWFNKPFEGGGLYDAAIANGGPLGYSSTPFSSVLVQAWEPKETRLRAPDNKIALGLAVPVSNSLTLALCFRYAELYDRSDSRSQDGNGDPLAVGASLGSLVDGSGGYYSAMDNWDRTDIQSATGLLLAPQFSYFGERFTLSAKADFLWAGVDNEHAEGLVSAAGAGSLSQSLKEKGTLSWSLKPHFRYSLNANDSLVLRGEYSQLGFNTEHRVVGHFAGSGFSSIQAAGFDHADATQDLKAVPWQAVLGYTHGFDRGKSIVVLGAALKGETDTVLDRSYQIRNSPSSYDDLVRLQRVDATVNSLAVPVFMGAEIDLKPWVKVRGMVSRHFYDLVQTDSVTETYDATDALSSRVQSRSSVDSGKGWDVALGFGLDLGSFNWDTAVNAGFLASPDGAAFSDPIYQSSLTYGY